MGGGQEQFVKQLYGTRTGTGSEATVWEGDSSSCRLVNCCMGQGQEQVGKLLYLKGTAAGC